MRQLIKMEHICENKKEKKLIKSEKNKQSTNQNLFEMRGHDGVCICGLDDLTKTITNELIDKIDLNTDSQNKSTNGKN